MAEGDDGGHTPDSCPGLAECREGLRANRAFFTAHHDWLTERFGDQRREMEKGFAGIHELLNDLRRAALLGDRDIVETRRLDGAKYEGNWIRVFARIDRLERHAAMQWVLVVMLGMMALGRGTLWLYGLLAGGGGP